MTLENVNTIVIHRSIALGDVIWVTSLLPSLRNLNRTAKIVVSTGYPDVFIGNPYVDEILADGYQNIYNSDNAYIINLDGSYESNRLVHMVDAYKATAGLSGDMPDPSIYLTDSSLYSSKATERGYRCKKSICIHMAATSPDRIIKEEVWREVVTHIVNDTEYGVVVVGANSDYGDGDWGKQYYKSRYMSFVGKSGIKQTAGIIGKCDAFIGVDSGMSHISFAMKVPSVVIYSMVSPRFRTPRTTRCIPVTASELTVKCLFCVDDSPSTEPPVCIRSTNKAECMDVITSSQILEALGVLLKN